MKQETNTKYKLCTCNASFLMKKVTLKQYILMRLIGTIAYLEFLAVNGYKIIHMSTMI